MTNEHPIKSLYIINDRGELLYSRTFARTQTDVRDYVFPYLMLFYSENNENRLYTMDIDDMKIAFMTFDSFVIATLVDKVFDASPVQSRVLSLGSELVENFSELMEICHDGVCYYDEINEIIDRYLEKNISLTPKDVQVLEEKIKRLCESSSIIYIGIIDENRRMICGNIPDRHLRRIISELKPSYSTDAEFISIPTTVNVGGYGINVMTFYGINIIVVPTDGNDGKDAANIILDNIRTLVGCQSPSQ